MPNAFVQSTAKNFETALHLMETALADTPDRLWETDLWPDAAPTGPRTGGGLDGSAPWFLGYHALTVLDYDLSGELEQWQPPKPFDENVWSWPARVFTEAELVELVEYCRARVSRTLDRLSEDSAARPLPGAHRHCGTLYGVLVGSLPLHLVEHASQIRQFLTTQGVRVQPVPGDRGFSEQPPQPG